MLKELQILKPIILEQEIIKYARWEAREKKIIKIRVKLMATLAWISGVETM